MNRKIFIKTILTMLLAFFAAGGACYEPARTATSEEMVAFDIFTSYRITDHTSDDGKCTRSVSAQFLGENRIYQLQPLARATYNGAELSFKTNALNEFDCRSDTAGFVLTDNRGGTKQDVYELKKVRLDIPSQIERGRDLRIPIEFDSRLDHTFSGTIKDPESGTYTAFRSFQLENETHLAERLNSPDMAKDAAYFLPKKKLLVFPKHLFAPPASGDLLLNISFEQTLYKPMTKSPENSLKRGAFSYKYILEEKMKLK